jgi:hypothetical protein
MLLLAFVAGLVAGPLLFSGWRGARREEHRRRQLLDRFKRISTRRTKAKR